MRNLPTNPSSSQQRVIDHATEVWGALDRHAMNVALYAMGRRSGLDISDEVVEDAWIVKQNMGV